MRARWAWAAAAVAALLAPAAGAQTVYLAVGDSITFGVGDDESRPAEEQGYPGRLDDLLADRGVDAEVLNLGVPGETTGELLSRAEEILDQGGDVMLLMEGTNDVVLGVSAETVRFNLAEMADRAADRGIATVHATLVPRLPAASTDGTNRVTGRYSGEIRDEAWLTGRTLADPYHVFREQIPDAFDRLYVGGGDNLHPNAAGYDELAAVFADVLTGIDELPPVTGFVTPFDDQQNVPGDIQIQIDLYDFGAGIDTDFTRLLVDGEPVPATISGDERKQEIRYLPEVPFSGVVFVGLEARDLQVPPLERTGTLLQFVTAGTDFLPGDISRDGRVDGQDLVALAFTFGSEVGDGRFRNFADLNNDGRVDGEDLAILASNFGQSSV